MNAMIYTRYGLPDQLSLATLEQPVPTDDQLLVRVHAAAVNAGDWHLLTGTPWPVRAAYGFWKPKHTVLGSDVAGRVEAMGKNVTQFQIGDEVFGDLSSHGFGGFAEVVCADARAFVHKPSQLSFEEASAAPSAAVTALQGLRDIGKLQAGQRVLINGASGGVGTFALQIAKALGAEVTAVCSTKKMEMARSLGADQVIDYTQTDVMNSAQRYELILDVAAYRSFLGYRRLLKPSGRYVIVGGSMMRVLQVALQGAALNQFGSRRFLNVLVKPNGADLLVIKALLETGKIKSIVERCYPLLELPEALGYLGAGHARGKLVIKLR